MRQHPFVHCFLILLCPVISQSSHAAIDPILKEDWQVAHYGEVILDDLNFTGYVTLDGTTVRNSTHIDGYMHAHFVNFGKLVVNGHARIQDTKIENRTEIEGKLLAINVDFKGVLVCRSDEITLSHCRAPSLFIKKTSEQTEQVIELSELSEISGPIIFESKKGKVIASKDSIFQKIEGGILVRK